VTYTPIAKGTSDWDVPVNAAFTEQDGRITTNSTSIDTINNTLTGKVSKSGDSLSGAYTLNNGSGVALTATANGTNNLVEFRDNTNAIRSRIGLNGNIVADGAAYFVSGIQMGSTSTDFGGGTGGVIGVDNATATPTTNPTNGVVIYSEGGVLKVRQASGAVVNLGTLTTVDWQPSDHGLIGWTQDPAGVNTDGVPSTSGVVYLSRINVRYATTISNLVCTVAQTAGSGLTAGQNWIGLYSSAGSKLAEVNMDTDFTSIGTKTKAITPQAVSAGHVYLALLTNGTTPPRFLYGNGTSASALNVNILPSGGAPRFVDFGTGQTTLPSSVTLTSSNTNASARWGAIF
jgi:hypothetical protein